MNMSNISMNGMEWKKFQVLIKEKSSSILFQTIPNHHYPF